MNDHIMSPIEAASIVRSMQKGDRITYYEGFLARDRAVNTDDGRAVHHLADFMLCQASRGEFVLYDGTTVNGGGLGSLTQKRLAAFRYAYQFTRES